MANNMHSYVYSVHMIFTQPVSITLCQWLSVVYSYNGWFIDFSFGIIDIMDNDIIINNECGELLISNY